jgi:hypothetical protein
MRGVSRQTDANAGEALALFSEPVRMKSEDQQTPTTEDSTTLSDANVPAVMIALACGAALLKRCEFALGFTRFFQCWSRFRPRCYNRKRAI